MESINRVRCKFAQRMTYLHPGSEYKFTFKKFVRVSGYGLDGSGFV